MKPLLTAHPPFRLPTTTTMKLLVVLSSLLALMVASVLANPSLDVLQLHSLTHSNNSLRTSLKVLFPSDENPQGSDHWFLLRDLNPQQRYELRVCWAAVVCTQLYYAYLFDLHTD